jgi:hypothetical protein
MTLVERMATRKKYDEDGLIDPVELKGYLCSGGRDPLLLTIRRLCAERDRKQQSESPISQTPGA